MVTSVRHFVIVEPSAAAFRKALPVRSVRISLILLKWSPGRTLMESNNAA